MATLNGCTPEVYQRATAMFADPEAKGQIVLDSGYRTKAQQLVQWLKAVKEHPLNPRKWAAFPGTSKHERGEALDVGGNATVRARLAKKYGFYFPLDNEPWHEELDPNRKPLSAPAPVPTTEDDEMSEFLRTIVWQNGTKTVADEDGGIFNGASKIFYGTMTQLRPENRKSFKFVKTLTPVDIDDEAAGYIFTDQDGHQYKFNKDTLKQFG